MRTVFMGTPDFACEVLKGVISAGHEVGYVITQVDKAKNRGKKVQFTAVKEVALEHGIEVLQPERIRNDEEVFAKLQEYAPDIIIVVAYGQIIPKNILDLPKFGCINVHASLLPRLRGASPIQHAILAGDKETGVTIMQMGEGLDTGDMLTKRSIEIGRMNYSQLHDALAEIGTQLLVDTLPMIERGEITPEPQNDEESTYASLISKQDGKIDFTKSPEEIERLIRGFDPWPGAFCDMGELTLKLWTAEPCSTETAMEDAGKVIAVDKDSFTVACGGGALKVTEIQVPGKKRTLVYDYFRGNKIEKGTVLA